jgi:hypothetical protein
MDACSSWATAKKSLTNFVIDSLNEVELAKGLSLPPETKGISKFKAFLKASNVKTRRINDEESGLAQGARGGCGRRPRRPDRLGLFLVQMVNDCPHHSWARRSSLYLSLCHENGYANGAWHKHS